MNTMALAAKGLGGRMRSMDRVWMAIVIFSIGLAVMMPDLAKETAVFVGDSFLTSGVFIALAVFVTAYAQATDADTLIARAFTGREVPMILVSALFGALSPFCSCGVIPLIAALLAMGVPLSAVMAFWLASPLMDPSMFFLTAAEIGMEFAIAKTGAAIAIGLMGGGVVFMLSRAGIYENPLREGAAPCGCSARKLSSSKPVVWAFWSESERVQRFGSGALSLMLFLGKWLLLAYMVEHIMLTYIPADAIASTLGDGNTWAIPLGALVGIPAYLNGYAAVGLMGGLVETGVAPGAAMAFLIAGGVTSCPATIAVFALVRLPVFATYLGMAAIGSLMAGYAYQFYIGF